MDKEVVKRLRELLGYYPMVKRPTDGFDEFQNRTHEAIEDAIALIESQSELIDLLIERAEYDEERNMLLKLNGDRNG